MDKTNRNEAGFNLSDKIFGDGLGADLGALRVKCVQEFIRRRNELDLDLFKCKI